MGKFFKASFGGVEMLLESMDGDAGRDWAVISPHRGDLHSVQDQGRRLRRVQCSVLFTDQPGLPDHYLDRYRAFEAMASDGKPQIFTHPIHGSYLAVVESTSYGASAESASVRCSCSFLAVQEPQAVRSIAAGVAAVAGPEEVGVSATAATAELTALGETSDTPTDCLAAAEAWANGDTADARQVLLEVASLTSQIDADVDRLELVTDYQRWAAYKAMLRLRYSVSRAAQAATASASRVVEYNVRVGVPLRVLCARLYGARVAEEMADQVARINGLRITGRIPPGTVLRVPSEGLSA